MHPDNDRSYEDLDREELLSAVRFWQAEYERVVREVEAERQLPLIPSQPSHCPTCGVALRWNFVGEIGNR